MKIAFVPLALGALALGGCTPQIVAGETAATIYLSRPDKPPPADTQSQIAEHEVWCYKTMADTECFSAAQDVPAGRLVNVEPQNLYPLTPKAYHDEIAGIRPTPAATAKPVSLNSKETDTPEKEKSFIEKITDYTDHWRDWF